MSERHKDQLARFPRWLVTLYAASLIVCLLFGGLPDVDGQAMGRYFARSLVRNLMAVAFTLGICYFSGKHSAASARAQGRSARDVAEAELSAGLGPSIFLPIYGGMAVEDLGWAWGALFFMIFVLYGVHLLLRWRRYMTTLAEAG